MSTYNYTKTPCALDSLIQSIQQSAIATALNIPATSLYGSALVVSFNGELSETDQATLDAIVSAHTGVPLPQNTVASVTVVSQPEQLPFAQPTYRTKRDATASWIDCPEDQVTDIDFLLTAERYVSGGSVIYKDAQEGDYISAEVRDIDGVIPSPYRAATCESHPTVSQYIVKIWLKPGTGYNSLDIDTYPLNAKIPAGIYLRVSYHSSSAAGTRKIAINYHLTRKL